MIYHLGGKNENSFYSKEDKAVSQSDFNLRKPLVLLQVQHNVFELENHIFKRIMLNLSFLDKL